MERRVIGVCLSTIQKEDRFYFIEALNKHAVEAGFRLMVFNSCSDLYEKVNSSNAGEAQVFRLIPYEKLAAMIVFPCLIWQREYINLIVRGCRKHGVPLISIDEDIGGRAVFSFGYANSFEEMCQHVIRGHGARRVKFMAGVKDNRFSEERADAFRRALASNGIPFDQDMIGYGDFWAGPTTEVLIRWFETEKQPLPQAIICANDTMAITVSNYLQDKGWSVPEDCIVTGFDGIMQADFHIPQLTTCRQDYDTMGSRVMEAIQTILSGGEPEKETVVDFSLRPAASCGCVPMSARRINHAVNAMYDRLYRSQERQTLMCGVQSSISKMSDISELPSVIIDKFMFATNIFAVNSDIFEAPDFGAYHKHENSFSDEMNILYQRYNWQEYPTCKCSRSDFIPHLDLLLEREEPILVCAVHFFDLVFGCCVFQPSIDFDEYEKMHTSMTAINSSLGAFHGQLQIRSINRQLMTVNDKLEELYVHDDMTGLLNRRGFYLLLKHHQDELLGEPMSVAFISADLDGLKHINDTYGHIEGDNAITTVAKALTACTRASDICARFGGDEFAVCALIPSGTEDSYFERFRTSFHEYLEKYNAASGLPYQVESSIGCYSVPLSAELDLDSVIKRADDLMYADKTARKKRRS